ncbi:uncharacterized protein [Zea mays]|uniref:uncharacterized protein isoform X2 n=1 Tax=Zea mays TaxID=4577 RepID=UPI0009A9DF12|nr:uncharacterized protein LOC109943749 isoform X2 [Zea mays]|eukprot:XP_020402834.1 uncharacterized protein LOC109943749 isoform X2 [Zea mays]
MSGSSRIAHRSNLYCRIPHLAMAACRERRKEGIPPPPSPSSSSSSLASPDRLPGSSMDDGFCCATTGRTERKRRRERAEGSAWSQRLLIVDPDPGKPTETSRRNLRRRSAGNFSADDGGSTAPLVVADCLTYINILAVRSRVI